MSTASPQERDLAIGRHAVMAEAFELLADHLGPFIDVRMAQYFVDEPSWSEAAANRLGRPTEHGATDPLFQLLVLRRFWGPVFADFYGEDLRKIIGQLIDTRNMWAHFSFPEDPSALQRSVLAIERLLAPVEPDTAAHLRRLRSRVDNPVDATEVGDAQFDGPSDDDPSGATKTAQPSGDAEGPEADPAETHPNNAPSTTRPATAPPTASSISPATPTADGDPLIDTRSSSESVSGSERSSGSQPNSGSKLSLAAGQRPSVGDGAPAAAGGGSSSPEVDVATLLAQLIETESVFLELQDRYGSLQEELNHTRRITANKQMKLSVMEQRLVEVEDQSLSVLEDLKEERVTRQHIEWLIVGLLATLLLFMVLAST